MTRRVAAIADRLRIIRIAYGRAQGFEKECRKAQFARLCGLTPQAWNNAESGQNQIGIQSAVQICCMTGVTLDYIFRGNSSALPYSLAVQIAKLKAES